MLAWQLFWLAFAVSARAFAIDEFYYGHVAWAFARSGGAFWTPMSGLAVMLYPWVRLAGDEPSRLLLLRLWPTLLLLLSWGALGLWWRRQVPGRALAPWAITVLMALNCPTPLRHAVEIRPDGPAWCLFAIGLCCAQGLRAPVPRTLLTYLPWALAAWTTPKIWLVFLALSPVFLWECLRPRTDGWFPLPRLAGSVLLLGLVLLFLSPFRSVIMSFLDGVRKHQAFYTTVDGWSHNLRPAFLASPWWPLGALAGLAGVARDVLRQRRLPASAAWALAFLGAMVSYFAQRAPFAYSQIPLWGSGVVLGGWAAIRAWAALARRLPSRACHAGLALVLLPLFLLSPQRIGPRLHNTFQLSILSWIGAATSADQPVFDASASYAFRPSAYPRALLEMSYVRRLGVDRVQAEVMAWLRDAPPRLILHDIRSDVFFGHTPLAAWLRQHYWPVFMDICIYGREFFPGPGEEVDFPAPWTDRYYLAAPEGWTLQVPGSDAVILPFQPFALSAGRQRLRLVRGENAAEADAVHVLWYPGPGRAVAPQLPWNSPFHTSVLLPD